MQETGIDDPIGHGSVQVDNHPGSSPRERETVCTTAMSSAAHWRLFPPPVKPGPPSVGDEVFVRTKSAKEIGKKGIVSAFEKVDTAGTTPPEPAASTAPLPPLPMKGNEDGVDGGSTCGGHGATIWREVKRQKKKKKPKKWEETRAVVRVSPPSGGKGDPFHCRARPSRLVPIYGVPPPANRSRELDGASARPLLLLLTAETLPYRLLAASQVRPTDRVLEVGCSTGETTVVLAKYVPRGCVVALDVGADMVERTKERLRLASADARVAVHKIDPFLDPRGAVDAASSAVLPGGEDGTGELPADARKGGCGRGGGGGGGDKRRKRVDAVFIDIGGNREVRGVVRMIAFARTAFASAPRLIVVKSQALVAELKAGSDATRKADDSGATAPSVTRIEAGRYTNCGTVFEGDSWFRELLARSSEATPPGDGRGGEERVTSNAETPHIPKHFHPNKAPLRLSPADGATPICRYHNYHKEGCKKGDRCPFDHASCHWCLRTGHIALDCDDISEFSAPR